MEYLKLFAKHSGFGSVAEEDVVVEVLWHDLACGGVDGIYMCEREDSISLEHSAVSVQQSASSY
jgi:hypothetical protein